jgi:hypothetical protein
MSPGGQLGLQGVIAANGTITAGETFTCKRNGVGDYTVTFTPPFESYSAPGVTPIEAVTSPSMSEVGPKGFRVKFALLVSILPADSAFSFQVFGY